ncbi:MAG: GntR family transcriptional regulator [Synergistaceae bacterium]|jgi:GntR family transcriptional regulator|nr:GntR family transcriptional regulator [Synergistaceae bacterium]
MNGIRVNNVIPLYQRLYDYIRERIDGGEYRPGDRIPSESALCAMLNVSRVTARSALQKLADDGILVKSHGRGTFVAVPAFVESMDAKGSFTESCIKMNAKPNTRLISREIVPLQNKIAVVLGAPDGSGAICLKRLRLVDGQPVIFEEDYFGMGYAFLLKEELENVSLFSLIQKKMGLAPIKFDNYFDVSEAGCEHAAHLECGEGAPLLRVRQTVKAIDNQAMYFNEQYIRSDRYKYAVCSS